MTTSTQTQGSFAPQQEDGARTLPLVSVVVPVRNEEPHIQSTIDQLLAQCYPPDRFEILVIDGQSTDATPDIVRRMAAGCPRVRLYDNPKRLSSAARNVGVRHARGEIIVVVDGHCEIADDRFLARLADAFAVSGADCVGRPQPLEIGRATRLQRAVAAARASWLGHHPDSFIYSGRPQFVPAKSVGVAYRREVFDRVGLFDEAFDACEDVEFNHRVDRAGLTCYFSPDTAVGYHPRSTLRGLFYQMTRYGRGRVRLARKHPETMTLKTAVPALFVMGCIAGLVAAMLSPWLAIAYAAALTLYFTTVLAVSAACAWQHRSWALLPLLPAVFVTIHLGSGTGLLREFFQGRRPQ